MKWFHKWIISVLLFSVMLVTQSNAWGGGGSSNTPKISIADISIQEGNSSTTTATLTISIDNCPNTSDIKIKWETNDADGNATSGVDYNYTNGTITFSKSSGWGSSCTKSYDITVDIIGDTDIESDETFKVIMSDNGTDSSQHYSFDPDRATVTILNDDVPNTPAVANAGSDITIAEGDDAHLDGNQSHDNSGIATYQWSVNGHTYGPSSDSNVTILASDLNLGDNTVTLTIEANDGDTDTDTVTVSVLEVVENADDLCYEDMEIIGGFMCKMSSAMTGGMCTAGMGCGVSVPLRNRGDSNLTDVHVVYDEGGMGGGFGDSCGVSPDGNCSSTNDYEMGGASGGFSKATVYDINTSLPPSNTSNASVWEKNSMSAFCFMGQNLYGSYIKDDVIHRGHINPCTETGSNSYATGPFDAWDTFRDVSDRNISTKLSSQDFNLTIASINADNNDTEAVPGKECRYRLLDVNTSLALTDWVDFNASIHDTQLENNINIDSAHRQVFVQFKFCQKKNTSPIELGTFNDCDTNATYYEYNTSTTSSDGFAIRPKEFALALPTSQDKELLKSGIAYGFKLTANDANDAQTQDYNQTKSNIDLNQTLILADGTEDNASDPLLEGTLSFDATDFNISDGVSVDANGSNNAVRISFDNVGKVKISLVDKDWASIDSDDTPNSCEDGTINDTTVSGTYICGTNTAIFIPDHFTLVDVNLTNKRKGDNFTYISNDLNMSAHVELTIKAMNAKNQVVTNFKENNTTYYENPIELNLSVPTEVTFTDGEDMNISHQEHNITRALLGFGGSDSNGTHTIAWNENNESQKILFNYDRANNKPINPFEINGSNINITVNSLYISSSGVSATITGSSSAEQNATFVYGRARSTKYFYDDITTNSANTPIKVEVYCDKWPASANCPSVDVLNGATNDAKWYISTSHNTDNGDGHIYPFIDASYSASVSPSEANITNGIANDVTISNSSGALPYIVNVTLDDTSPTQTSSWLVYNPDSPDTFPNPFYKVRFIGNATWSGEGKTGNVVDTNASMKKPKRLDW